MSTEVWPFLVSRNRVVDYTVIEAPKFAIENNIFAIDLIRITSGGVTEPGQVLCRPVRNESGEDFTLVFRVDRAQLGGADLRDGFGRPIVWVRGFILRGLVREISVTEEDLQVVHESVIQTFQDFWHQTKCPPIGSLLGRDIRPRIAPNRFTRSP
jgi:hypothetical protein